MADLSDRDLRRALGFAYDAGAFTGDELMPREVLERLAALIPADVIVGYHEAVIGRPCRVIESVEIPADSLPPQVQKAGALLPDQDPLNHSRSLEVRALKLSDFLTGREMRKLDFYWSVWRPLGIEDSLRMWLDAPAGRARVIYLERSKRSFSERDRALLQLLRPTLIGMQASIARRRRLNSASTLRLGDRESEILSLVAEGKTSKQIAVELGISPNTVRKHVQHILEKLDVRTRSAAVARLSSALNNSGARNGHR